MNDAPAPGTKYTEASQIICCKRYIELNRRKSATCNIKRHYKKPTWITPSRLPRLTDMERVLSLSINCSSSYYISKSPALLITSSLA